jgi:Na+-driven multidrug efflux pump
VPNFRLLFSLLPTFLSHHLLNVLAYAPPLAMPMLVSVVISPIASAAFYAVWMILIIVSMMPAALTNVLYTLGTSDPHALAERLRFSLLASLAFSAVVSFVFYLYSYQILSIFNSSYAQIAASSLQLLGISLITGSVRLHYIAVIRIRNEMWRASGILAASGIGGLAAATFGGLAFDLRGLAIAWILVGVAEAAVMLNTVVEAGWPAPHGTILGMFCRDADG